MRLPISLLAAALAVACSPGAAPEETTDRPAAQETAAGAAEEGAAGRAAQATGAGTAGEGAMRIWIDPETGRRLPPPERAEGEPAGDPGVVAERMSRRDDDLLEEPLPGGGVKVDLAGRFHTATTATIRPDGSLEIDCETAGNARPAEDAGGDDES